ncbi:MAG: peptidoglycan endopeptidase, partial [Porphyrobacter sp.]|nr:peptidoglycan endopeptidase [Porphyrobacter sp.]
MNSAPVALAEAALALVGVRFRLHGRDPTRGLDCVGVVVAALAAVGRVAHLPARYSLRRNDVEVFVAAAGAVGLARSAGRLEPG